MRHARLPIDNHFDAQGKAVASYPIEQAALNLIFVNKRINIGAHALQGTSPSLSASSTAERKSRAAAAADYCGCGFAINSFEPLSNFSGFVPGSAWQRRSVYIERRILP